MHSPVGSFTHVTNRAVIIKKSEAGVWALSGCMNEVEPSKWAKRDFGGDEGSLTGVIGDLSGWPDPCMEISTATVPR